MAFLGRKASVVNEPVADKPVADEPDFTLALEEARRGFDSLEKHLADIRNRSQQIVGIRGPLRCRSRRGSRPARQSPLKLTEVVDSLGLQTEEIIDD